MYALKRHFPLEFIPTFFIVNFTAGRLLDCIVDVATNESAVVDAR